MGKHLTLDDRITIQNDLSNLTPLNEIAKTLGKSRSTISREIRNHLVTVKKGGYSRAFNECVHRFACKKTGICESKPDCTRNCRFCSQCNENCADFEKESCSRLSQSPYVCNGCSYKNKCTLEKKLYVAADAYKEYRKTLAESREGFNLTETEFLYIDAFLSERLKKGQSIYNIVHTCPNTVPCSESTMYRLVHSGTIKARTIDLPRAVRFRSRRKKSCEMKIDKKCRLNRTYNDFKNFINENPDVTVTEIDSVEGTKGGAVLLTMILTNCNFMLAFIRERNNAQSVIDIFNSLYCVLSSDRYKSLFGVLLGDNGTEFSNPEAIEYADDNRTVQRSRMFYCDPSSPYQKGKVENNHEMIRKIIPKGYPLDSFSQKDIDIMMSNINSYGRPQFNGVSPTELFIRMYGENTLHLLGQELIPPEKIILKPSLLV